MRVVLPNERRSRAGVTAPEYEQSARPALAGAIF